MPDNEESVIFEQSNVKVTSQRVIIGPKTYVLSNITSVRLGRRDSVGCFAICLIFLGLILAASGITQVTYNPRTAIGVLVFGAIIAAAGFALKRAARPTYTVNLGSAAGESNILESKVPGEIQPIVGAIHGAVVRRG
jgi:hypothetical protein